MENIKIYKTQYIHSEFDDKEFAGLFIGGEFYYVVFGKMDMYKASVIKEGNLRQVLLYLKDYINSYHYQYVLSNSLQPESLFFQILVNQVKQDMEQTDLIKNQNFNQKLAKAYKFFKDYEPIYENLYGDFEEKSALIPLYGKQERELRLLRDVRPDEYKEKIISWIEKQL